MISGGIIFIAFIIIVAYVLFVPILFRIQFVYDGNLNKNLGFRVFPFAEFKLAFKRKTTKSISQNHYFQTLPAKKRKLTSFIHFIMADIDLFKKLLFESIRFFWRLTRVPEQRQLQLSLAGGLDSPHLTGQIYGLVCAAQAVLPESISIDYKPDFLGERLIGDIALGCKFRLAAFIKEIIIFIIKLPKIRLIKLAVKFRKEGKYADQN